MPPRSAGFLLAIALVACRQAQPIPTDAASSSAHAVSADAGSITTEAAAPDPEGTYMGRTIAKPMSYAGADWLDRPNRAETQRPEYVLDVLAIQPGQTVADVGCGSGYFTTRLAKRVGATGTVLATDLQPEMLALLRKKLAAEKITNVVTTLATPEDAMLPVGKVDLVLLVDVYHELPKPPVTLAQIRKALAPKGRLALVEYRAEDPKVAIKPEHKTTLVQLKREIGANGFVFVSSDESLPEQRIVIFEPAR